MGSLNAVSIGIVVLTLCTTSPGYAQTTGAPSTTPQTEPASNSNGTGTETTTAIPSGPSITNGTSSSSSSANTTDSSFTTTMPSPTGNTTMYEESTTTTTTAAPRPVCLKRQVACNTTDKCVTDVRICNFVNECGGPNPGDDEEGCIFKLDAEQPNDRHGWGGQTFAHYFSGEWTRVMAADVGIADHTSGSPQGYVLNATARVRPDGGSSLLFESVLDSPLIPTNSTHCALKFSYYLNRTLYNTYPRLTAEVLHQSCRSYYECLYVVQNARNLNAQFSRSPRYTTRAMTNGWKTVQFPLDPPIRNSIYFVRIRAEMLKSRTSVANEIFLDDVELIDCEPPILMNASDCGSEEFYCNKSQLCIDSNQVCDIRRDCRFEEDEETFMCDERKKRYSFTSTIYVNSLIQYRNGHIDSLDWIFRRTSPSSSFVGNPHTEGLPSYTVIPLRSVLGWTGGYMYVPRVIDESRRNFSAIADLSDVFMTNGSECTVIFYVAFSDEIQDMTVGYRYAAEGPLVGTLWKTNITYPTGVWNRQVITVSPSLIVKPFRLTFITQYTGVALDGITIDKECVSSENKLPEAETTWTPPITPPDASDRCSHTEIYCDISRIELDSTGNTTNKKCLPKEKRCNFVKDCRDGSDEIGCAQEKCTFSSSNDTCGWTLIKPENASLSHALADRSYNQWAIVHSFSYNKEALVDYTTNSTDGYYLTFATKSRAAGSTFGIGARVTSTLSSGLFSETGPECSLRFYSSAYSGYIRFAVNLELDSNQTVMIFQTRGSNEERWKEINLPIGARRNFKVLLLASYTFYGNAQGLAIDDLQFIDCAPLTPSPVGCLPDAQYRCDGGSCISADKVCDIKDDCGDRSDELEDYCKKSHSQCTFEPFTKCTAWIPDPDEGLSWTVDRVGNRAMSADHTTQTSRGQVLRMTRNQNVPCRATYRFPPEDYGTSLYSRLSTRSLASSSHDCKIVFYYNQGNLPYQNVTLQILISSLSSKGVVQSSQVIYTEVVQRVQDTDLLSWKRLSFSMEEWINRTNPSFRVSILVEVPKYRRLSFLYLCSYSGLYLDDLVLTSGCKADTPGSTHSQFDSSVTGCMDGEFACPSVAGNKSVCLPAKKVCNFQRDCPAAVSSVSNETFTSSSNGSPGDDDVSDVDDESMCGTNCTFDDGLCGWKPGATGEPVQWRLRDKTRAQKWNLWHLVFGSETAIVTTGDRVGNGSFESLIYQRPHDGCSISFRYLMKGMSLRTAPSHNVTYLNVWIKSIQGTEELISNISLKHEHDWITQTSRISINTQFLIRFEVVFLEQERSGVAVDNIKFNNCDYGQDSVSCSSEQFSCLDKMDCIPRYHVCDSMPHCTDGSDEDPTLCNKVVTQNPANCKSSPLEPHKENCIWGCDFSGSDFAACHLNSTLGRRTEGVWGVINTASVRRPKRQATSSAGYAVASSSPRGNRGDVSDLITTFALPASFDYCRVRFGLKIEGDSALKVMTSEVNTGNQFVHYVYAGTTKWRYVNVLVGSTNNYSVIFRHVSGDGGKMYLDNVTLTQECFKQELTPDQVECFAMKCEPTQQCIPPDWVCDGRIDCPDGSDEAKCTTTSTTTTTTTTTTAAATTTEDLVSTAAATTIEDLVTTASATTTEDLVTTASATTTEDLVTTASATTTEDLVTTAGATTTEDLVTTAAATTTEDLVTTASATTTEDLVTTVAATTEDLVSTAAANTTGDLVTTVPANSTVDLGTTPPIAVGAQGQSQEEHQSSGSGNVSLVVGLCVGLLLLTIIIIAAVVVWKRTHSQHDPVTVREMFKFKFTASVGKVSSEFFEKISSRFGNNGNRDILTNDDDYEDFSSQESTRPSHTNKNTDTKAAVFGIDNALYQNGTEAVSEA